MTPFLWQNLQTTILLPVCLTAAGLFLLRWLPERAGLRRVATALVLALSLGMACVGIRGWAGFWPVDVTLRLPAIALCSVLASGLVEAVAARNSRSRLPLALITSLLISAVLAGIFTGTAVIAGHSLPLKILWWGSLTLILTIGRWLAGSQSAQKTTFWTMWWQAGGFLLLAGAVSIAGVLSLAQVGLAYAISLMILGLLAGITPARYPPQATAELSATLAGMILISAWLFAELNPLIALTLFGILCTGHQMQSFCSRSIG